MKFDRLWYVLTAIWNDESNRTQRLFRLSLFIAWQLRKKISDNPLKARLFNGLRIWVWPDCGTSPAALYYSVPNGRNISFLRAHLNGGTFLDVGANVGLVSLLLGDKIENALLFEPNPVLVERAKQNLALNDLKFTVFAVALSDRTGIVDFEDLGASPCSRVVDGFRASAPTIAVQRVTFDSFIQQHPIVAGTIQAVKVDVEGHENAVFRGMMDFLRLHRPKIVMFEYLKRTKIEETLAIFGQAGYVVFELSTAGPQIADAQVAALQDLFACPIERTEEFGLKSGMATGDVNGRLHSQRSRQHIIS